MKISVIIPVYNAENFIEKAVYSALNQPEVNEIILIEDKSKDNSLNICQKLANEHSIVKLLQHKDNLNHGAGASRNIGLIHAQYEYISFLDADDFFLPKRFLKTKQVFFENPDAEGQIIDLEERFWIQ